MKRTPLRPKGAVLVNPRPKRGGSKSSALAALFGKRRKNPARRRRTARRASSLGEIIVNPRRRRARRRVAARSNPRRRVARRNPARKRRAMRRNPRRKDRRRVAAGSIIRTRRNPRRRYARRRNPHRASHRRNPRRRYARRRNGLGRMTRAGGGILGAVYALIPTSIAGALSVEPTLALAQVLSRYFPGMKTSWLYPIAGFAVALGAKKLLPKVGVSQATADMLAVATASAGGAVGYYKFRTGSDTDAASEMAGLVMSGYGSPIAGLVMGDSGLGELVTMAGYGAIPGGYGNVAPLHNPLTAGATY